MKVTTVSVQKPDIVITLSWEDAQILSNVCGGISPASDHDSGYKFTNILYGKLNGLGLQSQCVFSGKFRGE